MTRARASALASSLLFAFGAPHATGAPKNLVLCAPGFPGSTVEAQPTMDAFVHAALRAAGSEPGSFEAVYLETESGGVARLEQEDAVLALVTAPFFAKYRARLHLAPRLVAVGEEGSAEETYSLVAKRGAVRSPASLDGFEVTGMPGYAPGFVRGAILGKWGTLLESTRVTFTTRVTSALLKAASGQKVAVLLDGEQTKALASRPDAAQLEVVTTSPPIPSSFLCTVGERGETKDVTVLWQALAKLADRAGGPEVLASLRLKRFDPVDPAGIEAVVREPARVGPGK